MITLNKATYFAVNGYLIMLCIFIALQTASTLKYSTVMSSVKYKTLAVSVPRPFVYMVKLNRPEKLNAMNPTMWQYVIICSSCVD